MRLGRQVITYDPPESGQSTRAMRLSMAEMHDCADEALSVCGVSGPLDCAGHSMGGLALVAYAVERPARAARLCSSEREQEIFMRARRAPCGTAPTPHSGAWPCWE